MSLTPLSPRSRVRLRAVAGAAALLAATAFAGAPAADAATARPVTVPHVAGDLADGGFETPALAPGVQFTGFGTGRSLGPWLVTSGGTDLTTTALWQSADGRQSLDLNGSSPGSITQTVPTLPLTTYVITYSLAGNPDGGPAVKTGELSVNGHPLRALTFDVSGHRNGSMGYTGENAAFTSLGTSARITFASTTPGAYGPVIDAVHVHCCLLVLCL